MASILVIEDEANIARAVRDKLNHSGHAAESVLSGPKAFELLRDRSFDLIILDLLMPDMDGFEVIQKLKAEQKTSSIPIMLLTVLREDDRIAKLGVDAHLAKPYRGADLLRTVNEVLEKFYGGTRGTEKNPRS